jgi:thiol-disulfide isomerase/thioredoxin
MKKIIASIFLLTAFILTAQAQVTSVVKKRVTLDSATVVKDSAGNILPYAEWHTKIISGDYLLRSLKHPDSPGRAYVLWRMTAEEKVRRFNNMPKPPESKFFTMGEKIASFTADAIDGKSFKLKKLEGKIVVLNFWFIGCPPCRQEIPELTKLAAAYANDPDVVFISFGLDDRYDIKNFVKTTPFGYHIVDNGGMYANLYHINLYPTNVVLDKEGKVRFHSSGYTMNLPEWLKKTIDECK